jgi:hypothetical protein
MRNMSSNTTTCGTHCDCAGKEYYYQITVTSLKEFSGKTLLALMWQSIMGTKSTREFQIVLTSVLLNTSCL